jgi:hypothetical protein
MLISINSLSVLIKNFNFINVLFFKALRPNLSDLVFKKIYLNNYFTVKNKFLNNYFFFFKNIFKINNFFFIRCVNLILHSYFYKYVNTVYFLVHSGYNFYLLSENQNNNLFWIFDMKYLKKNLTKANFMRFLINFLRKNKIKLVVFIDFFFINFLNFFKKLNLITAGIVNVSNKLNFFNFPLFFQNSDIYNTYFLHSVTYDIYLIALSNNYNRIVYKFFKNYYKLNRILFII